MSDQDHTHRHKHKRKRKANEEHHDRGVAKEQHHDRAVDMTFPASDPTAHGAATSTEPPSRPVDREAPHITKEQIKQGRRSS